MKTTKTYLMIAACAMFLGMGNAFAQQQEASGEDTPTAKFGIKGGFNFSSLYVDDVKDEHVKVGGNIGFFAKLPITKGLSIQPELLYSNKGAKETYDHNVFGTTSYSGQYRFNLHYVEVPLLLVINITPNFSISGGGYAALLAGANLKQLSDDGNIDNYRDINVDQFNRFDYGLVGGASVDIDRVTLGVRYNYGLHNIGKNGTVVGNITENSKNSVAALFVGFAF